MRVAYRVLAGLIALGVIAQAASIAYGTFSLAKAIDGGTTINKDSTVGESGFIAHALVGEAVIPCW
ncbi:MAG: hypothetical protein WCB04_09325 [Mycobacteriales bacterium]